MSALQQAELIEKEKLINERQLKMKQMNAQVQVIAAKQQMLTRDKQRAKITYTELAKHKPDHTVYQAIGRMFVKTSVPGLSDKLKKEEARADNDFKKLSEDKRKLGELLEKEEDALRRDVAEFMATAKAAGVNPTTGAQPQA